jgi:hypothetical protein
LFTTPRSSSGVDRFIEAFGAAPKLALRNENIPVSNLLFVAPSAAGTSVIAASSADVSGSATVTIQAALPPAPNGLTAKGLGNRKLKLSWIDNAANESGFYVQTSTDGVNWTTIATLSPSTGSSGTVSYVTGSFPAGLRYVRVQAFNGFGSSTSNVVSMRL